MGILKKPYEITVWEDIWDSGKGKFIEQRIGIIGADSMQYQGRAIEPNLTRNANGTKKFTFKMYKHFIDNVTGEKVDNPFSDWLISERKVKLYYNSKWYDFIVKNISETTDKYLYSYQLEDALVQELSKNGFGVVLDDSNNNNSGNVQYLAEKVLEDTDWKVEAETFVQTIEESLVYLQTKKELPCYQIRDQKASELTVGCTFEKTSLLQGKIILGFYSSCTNKPYRFQFIYLEDLAELEKDDHRIITNKDCQYYFDIVDLVSSAKIEDVYKTPEDEGEKNLLNQYGFSIPSDYLKVFGMIEDGTDNIVVSGKYRGNRIGFLQQSKFIPKLNRYVNIYDKNGTEYYGYQHTEYNSPTLIQNVISGYDFSSTSGWIGTRLTAPEHRNLVLASDTPIEKTGYFIQSYKLTEDWIPGEQYSIAIKGNLTGIDSTIIQKFGIWANGSQTSVAFLDYDEDSQLHRAVFKAPQNITTYEGQEKTLHVYNYESTNSNTAKIEWIKLERSNEYITEYSKPIQEVALQSAEVENIYGYFKSSQFYNSIDKLNDLKNLTQTFTPYLKLQFKSPFTDDGGKLLEPSIIVNSCIYDNRISIGKIDPNEEWVLRCKYLNNSGAPLTEGLSFSLGEYQYDTVTGGYILSEDNIKFKLVKTVIRGGFVYCHFTVEFTNYDEKSFKRNSQIRLCIQETNITCGTYYLENIELFKGVYREDGSLILPEAQGETIEEGVIDSTYYYFLPSALNEITDAEELKSEYVSKKLNYKDYKPVFNNGAEKIRSISAKESNYFNILQSIAETFEAWLDLEIKRDDFGGITEKIVRFKNYLGNNNYAGFRYGVNLKSIKRTHESKKIVTKLIVKDNKNEFAKNGFCTISRAGANPTGENYIYDFQYFHNTGMLDARKYIDSIYSVDDAEGPDRYETISKIENYYAISNNNIQAPDVGWVIEPIFSENQADTFYGVLWHKQKIFFASGRIITTTPLCYSPPNYTWYSSEDGGIQLISIWYKISDQSLEEFQSWEGWSKTIPKLPDSGTVYIHQYAGLTFQNKTKFMMLQPIQLEIREQSYNINGYFLRVKNLNNRIDEKNAILLNISKDLLKLNADLEIAKTGKETAESQIEDCEIDFRRLTKLESIEQVSDDLKKRDDVKAVLQKYVVANQNLLKYTQQLQSLENNNFQDKYDSLSEEIKTLTGYKKKLNQLFYTKYSRFIQEGTWISEEYNDDEKYYTDALSTMYNSCYPQVAYTFDVLELSSLPGYEGFVFELGDKTFAEDPEFFGGDLREEVVITEITEDLDDPSKNKIKVQNFKNQFQDLFQKITATTQQAQYNTGSYEKAVALAEATQQRKQQFFAEALDSASSRLANAGQQTVTWGADGITITKAEDASERLRLVAGAILFSKKDENGQHRWVTGITSEGISANLITAGSINTRNISIMDSTNELFRWDKYGISAFAYNNFEDVTSGLKKDRFVRFDQYGLYGIDGQDGTSWYATKLSDIDSQAKFALTWEGLKVTGNEGVFAHIGKKDNSIVRVIKKEGETEVETFVVENNGDVTIRGNLYLGNGTSVEDLESGMPNSYSGTFSWSFDKENGITMWSGEPINDNRVFRIFKDVLDENKKKLEMSGTIIAKSGNIAGWTISDSCLHTNSNELYFGTGVLNGSLIGGIVRDNIIFKAGNQFGINNEGAIYAFSGFIGGWEISSNNITNANDKGGITLYGSQESKIFDGSPIAISGGAAIQNSRFGSGGYVVAKHTPYSSKTLVATIAPNKNEMENITQIQTLSIKNYIEYYSNLQRSAGQMTQSFTKTLTFNDLIGQLNNKAAQLGQPIQFGSLTTQFSLYWFQEQDIWKELDAMFQSGGTIYTALCIESKKAGVIKAQIFYTRLVETNGEYGKFAFRFYESITEAQDRTDNYVMEIYDHPSVDRVYFKYKDRRYFYQLSIYNITSNSAVRKFEIDVNTSLANNSNSSTVESYNNKNTFSNLQVTNVTESVTNYAVFDIDDIKISTKNGTISTWQLQNFPNSTVESIFSSATIDTAKKEILLNWIHKNTSTMQLRFQTIQLSLKDFTQIFTNKNNLDITGTITLHFTPSPYQFELKTVMEEQLPISPSWPFTIGQNDSSIKFFEVPQVAPSGVKVSYDIYTSVKIESSVPQPFVLTRNGNLYVQKLKTEETRVDISTKRKQHNGQLYLPLQTIVKNGAEFVVYTIYTNKTTDSDGDGLLNDFNTLSGLYIIDKTTWDKWTPVEN